MNLPTNHRLALPDELASGPWRNLKYRTKHEPAEWLTWDERLGAPDAKSLESFYFAVPAEEKGEGNLVAAAAEELSGNVNHWAMMTDNRHGNPYPQIEEEIRAILRKHFRPTPAIQQAVEALEDADRRADKLIDDPPENRAVIQFDAAGISVQIRKALRHLNGEVRG
jgi:hypothetical protein